jgi:glyoxalase family protein
MILGLHHVTATVNDAQEDLDFYGGVLGLRLVKKTINFDNPSVYHFYYGDERGSPGTIWTTFPYKGRGVTVGRHGTGQITTTCFSVPPGSLSFWQRRLTEAGATARERTAPFGGEGIGVRDPSGLDICLLETAGDHRSPWIPGGIAPETAVRGLHSITLTLDAPAPTVAFATELLGYQVVNEADGAIRLAVNGDLPGRRLDLRFGTKAPAGRNGLGTVHHVAMAVASSAEQGELREKLVGRGCAVTDVLDRQYFQSIYFREPGGVLFEVATVEPGFAIDEPLSSLGRDLKLPPWEEINRAQIQRSLPSVSLGARS